MLAIKGDFVLVYALLLCDRVSVKEAANDVIVDEGLSNDLWNVFHGQLLVEDLLREDDRDRSPLAKSVTTRLFDLNL